MKLSGPDVEEVSQQASLSPQRRRACTGTMLYVAPPAEPPSEPLLNCVRELIKRSFSVSAAYAFIMAIGGGAPTLSVGIYFDSKPSSHEVNELFSRIGYFMRPFLGEEGCVDLLPLDPTTVLTVAVRDTVKPFYRRIVQ
jgi:SseB protein C-terminal domain